MSPFTPFEYILREGCGAKYRVKSHLFKFHYSEIYNNLKTEWKETYLFSDPCRHGYKIMALRKKLKNIY